MYAFPSQMAMFVMVCSTVVGYVQMKPGVLFIRMWHLKKKQLNCQIVKQICWTYQICPPQSDSSAIFPDSPTGLLVMLACRV